MIRRIPPLFNGNRRIRDHPPAAAPQAGRRKTQLRQARGRRPRRLRGARHVGLAGGGGAPRRRRDRHPLPPLPQPPGPARGRLRRGARRRLPVSRRAHRPAAVGGAVGVAAPPRRVRRAQARTGRGAVELPRPRRRVLQRLPHRPVRGRGTRCSRAPRRPTRRARTSITTTSSRWSAGSGRTRPPRRSRSRASSTSRSTACATARRGSGGSARWSSCRAAAPARRRPRSSGTMRLASTLPSSTPHWSNESMSQIAPWVKTLCSYSATSLPERRGRQPLDAGSCSSGGCRRTSVRHEPSACPRPRPRRPSCRRRAPRSGRRRWPSAGRGGRRAG